MTTTKHKSRREQLDPGSIQVRVAPESYDEATREFEVVMSTGAAVRRYSYWTGRAYDEVLSIDAGHIRLERINSGRAPFCEEHRAYSIDAVVGSIVVGSVEVRGGELIGRVRMHETERAKEITQRMARGELCNVSLGYRTYEQEVVESEDGPDTRTAIDWEPYELSLVPMPADDGSHTRSYAGGADCVVRTEKPMDEDEITDEPTPTKGTTRTAPKTATKRTAPAPTPEPAPEQRSTEPPDAEAETRARRAGAEAERKRSAEIRTLVRRARLEDSVAEDLIGRDVSLDAARTAILEAWSERHSGDEVSNTVSVELDERTKRGQAVERVLLERFDGRKYALQDGDDARQMRGDSLMEIGMRYLRSIGAPIDHVGNKQERAAIILNSRAMHTSSDFPQILGNIAGRVLRDSYRGARRDFGQLVRERSAPDFKPITSVQLGAASKLEKVVEGGEYSYGTIGESGETYKIAKFGKILSITREAIINDDLDAFTRIPQKMGQQATQLENVLFWALLGENPTMADGNPLFHSSHGNVIDKALDVDALTEARTAMRLQKDLDGETALDIVPRFLVVPVELEMEAARLLVLQTVPTKTADTNPFQGSLTPIGSPFLSTYSAAEWYMLASPGEIDTFELAYLQGNREPYFETREGFERDGLEIKVRHEIGMKAIDWRGVVKSTGQN